MDGIIYLLNQAGIALGLANQRIAQLEAELAKATAPKPEDPRP